MKRYYMVKYTPLKQGQHTIKLAPQMAKNLREAVLLADHELVTRRMLDVNEFSTVAYPFQQGLEPSFEERRDRIVTKVRELLADGAHTL